MTEQQLSIISGPPLAEEEGIGALTLGGWLREVTERFATHEALVFHEGDAIVRWSYADLWEQALAVAKALVASGIGKGTRVGILMTNRPEFLSAVFGTALAGGVATTLSTFSTGPELDYLLQASACSVLLLERRVLKKDFAEVLAELEPGIRESGTDELRSNRFPFLRQVVAIDSGFGKIESWSGFLSRGRTLSASQIQARAQLVAPSDAGVLFFSSGSTSKPKGIVSAHRGVTLQLWRWRRFLAARADARAWSANGFFWSGNFGMAIGGALSAGGSLILQSTFQPEEALSLMEKERATMAFAWPHQWAQLEAATNWNDVDLSSLRYVNPTNPLGRHPTVSTDWQEPLAAYGNTETFTINAIFPSGTPVERIAGSSGTPVHGNKIKIVHPLTGDVVPMGERGEIAVKGATLMLGYIGVPLDETLDDEGYFRTGDGGYVDAEGRLYWEGRLNDIIKTGGANVSPVEIDTVIREYPGVKVSQTVGVPHDTLGEMVVACVVPHAGTALDEEKLRSFARDKIASYKVPRRVLFFAESEIELTGSAKIKTADLRSLAAKRLEGQL